jgi:4-hydroxy-4-methyl-2-oxoglutarate aldolase
MKSSPLSVKHFRRVVHPLRIPQSIVEEVLERSESAMATENKVRTSILAGMDPQEAYLKFGKF